MKVNIVAKGGKGGAGGEGGGQPGQDGGDGPLVTSADGLAVRFEAITIAWSLAPRILVNEAGQMVGLETTAQLVQGNHAAVVMHLPELRRHEVEKLAREFEVLAVNLRSVAERFHK